MVEVNLTVTTLLFDFSNVLIFAKDQGYTGLLNPLHQRLSKDTDYDFFESFELNERILDFLAQRQDRYGLYIFTAGSLHQQVEVKARIDFIFRRIFTTYELQLRKENPEAYRKIAQMIQRQPSEMLFIDDSFGNIEAAKQAGMNTILFESTDQLFEKLSEFITIA